MSRSGRVLAGVVLLGLVGCGQTASTVFTEIGDELGEEVGGGHMRLTSEAFEEGGAIPANHTCDGDDVSPPLAWDEVPEGTAALALIVEDPDARGFVHWVLADVPGDEAGLPEGEGDSIGIPGRNDFGRVGWGGPCPPRGEHRYVFNLYALSAPLELSGEADAAAVREAMQGKVLAEARLTGVYQRGG